MSNSKVRRYKNRGGYAQDRFIDNCSHLEEFLCSICHGIFYNPVVAECCDTTYCRFCIKTWFNKSKTCPKDRKALTTSGLNKVSNEFRNLLSNLNIKCVYECEGCVAHVKLCDLDNHQDNCEFRPNIECRKCGIIRKNANNHDCFESLLAAKSEWEIEKAKLDDQYEELSKNIVITRQNAETEVKKFIQKFNKETKARLSEFEKSLLEMLSIEEEVDEQDDDQDDLADKVDSSVSSMSIDQDDLSETSVDSN